MDRENTLQVSILVVLYSYPDIETLPTPYTKDMSGTLAKLVEFECRGCEFTEFSPEVLLL
jgi:Eukaryotic protein of unknown function (DUF866)